MTALSIIRHWDAKYQDVEHKHSFENVFDIRETSIEKLKWQAKEFVSKLKPDSVITIWSSPIPRAIETANIFIEELKSKWIKIRKQKIFKNFEEVKWFRWEYLKTMTDWWELEFEWKKYQIDKSKTNPKGLNYTLFFRNSAWKDIDPEYLASLGNLWKTLFSIETFWVMSKRTIKWIERVAKLWKHPTNHILLFSHQCCTDFIVELLNDYKNWWVATWESITLENNGKMDLDVLNFPQEITKPENVKSIIANTKSKVKWIF